jgi:hypothetical protein
MTKQNETKCISKKQAKGASVRIIGEDAKLLKAICAQINGKSGIRKVRTGEIISVSLRLFGEAQVREMQERAVTVKHRKELLRQKYIGARGPISAKEFEEFMTTEAYAEFLLEQRAVTSVAQISA